MHSFSQLVSHSVDNTEKASNNTALYCTTSTITHSLRPYRDISYTIQHSLHYSTLHQQQSVTVSQSFTHCSLTVIFLKMMRYLDRYKSPSSSSTFTMSGRMNTRPFLRIAPMAVSVCVCVCVCVCESVCVCVCVCMRVITTRDKSKQENTRQKHTR